MAASRENTVNVPLEPGSGLLSVIASMVRRIAVPTSIDPDEVYFDNGHARQIYKAITDAAPLHEGEGDDWSELVERLKRTKFVQEGRDERDYVCDVDCDEDGYGARAVPINPDGPEAADAILKLIASARSAPPPSVEVERLREALEPFAALADCLDDFYEDSFSPSFAPFNNAGQIRKARAALSRKQEPGVPTPGGEG
jgi:hypothetical protein